MGLLENKVAIVTGAGSGIGEASARRFAAEGAVVVAVDIRAGKAADVAEAIVAAGGHAISLGANVAEEDDVAAMVDAFPTHRLGWHVVGGSGSAG